MMDFINLTLILEKPELVRNFSKEIEFITGNKDIMGLEELIKIRLKEEGREEGLEKGLEQGLEQGRQQVTSKAIRNMLKRGFSEKDIVDLLEITNEEFLTLKNNIK